MALVKFDDAFLHKLDSLSIQLNSTINNIYSGGRRSKSHGSTVEFANFREYVQGDDFRRIDWNAYGRFEKFFIKLFLDEKMLTTSIFVDTSESMTFGTPSKEEMALKIAASFAYISASASDKVNIVGVSKGEARTIASGLTGKASFIKAIEGFEKVESKGVTNMNESVKSYRGLNGGSGLSILISDIMTDENYQDTVKYLLYKNQQVVLVHVLSREEISPVIDGKMRLTDSENNTYCDVEGNAKTLECYQKALSEYINSIKSFCMKMGVYYLPAVSDEEIEKIIMEKSSVCGILHGKM